MTEEHPQHSHKEPPFPEQQQEHPGLEAEMTPKPDFGEESYVGYGRLKGCSALITGGDSGIGRAVAVAFAKEGADVAITYLPQEEKDAKETERVVRAQGARCLRVPGDLLDDKFPCKLVKKVADEFGSISVLVHNAAYQGKAVHSFDEFDIERVMTTLKVNLGSLFELTKCALPHMNPGSSIITVASIEAYQPDFEILDYATTKGGIVAFTKGLSQHLIEKGIRVNCVAPGPVWTPIVVQSLDTQKVKQFGKQESPMKRPAQPVEIAPSFVFLASKESQYINGEILGVTGGGVLA